MPTNARFIVPDIASIARSYNVLADEPELRALAMKAFPKRNLSAVDKPGLHRMLNNLLLKQFRGEGTLKAKLVQQFIRQGVTAAFEIAVHRSRADFLTVNGDSKSFEIKSERDNLRKLAKQSRDYQRVFDFNYLVLDEKHYDNALCQVPERYGVYVLQKQSLVEIRKALPNQAHDPRIQLSLFTKRELAQSFPIVGINIEDALINFTPEEINARFKAMLKKRYATRWQFLLDHQSEIHPIDFQYFFQHNIHPSIIYRSC